MIISLMMMEINHDSIDLSGVDENDSASTKPKCAPDMESMAQSTMSAPALAQASCVATPVPAVSWVCTWMTRSGNASRSAVTSCVAARGFSRPAAQRLS